MRKLIIAAMLLFSSRLMAQVNLYKAPKFEATSSIVLRNYRIDSISNDTFMNNASAYAIPTQFAVKRLLANNSYSTVAWANITGKPNANGTTDGILTYSDWLGFNGKQAALNSTSGLGFVKANGTTISYDLTKYFNNAGDSATWIWLPNRNVATAFPSTGVTMFDSASRWGYRTSTFKTISFSTSRIATYSNYIDSFPDYSGTFVFKYNPDTIFNKVVDGSANTIKNVSLTTGVTGLLPDANVASAANWNAKTALNGTGFVKMTGTTPSYVTAFDSTNVTGLRSENYYNTKYLLLTSGDTIRSNVNIKSPNVTPTAFNGNLRVASSDAAASGKGATIAMGGNAATQNMNFAAITGRREDGSSDRGYFAIYTNGTGNDGNQWVERFRIGSDGDCSVNSVKNDATYVVPFTIFGTSGQSANLLNFKNSSGTVTTAIGANGEVTINGATVIDKLNVIGNINMQTAGNKIKQATGTNAACGTVTLSGGSATVSTTAVTANSLIYLTVQEGGTQNGRVRVSARVASTSFSISSSDAGDNCVIAYQIIN